jgi:hypothetical protein
VAKILAAAGHAVETVVNDYGEDLLVQTSHAGQVDASRLWIQVKSTDDIASYKNLDGSLSLSVSFDHAVRWSRSLDLVVVVLCDIESGAAWYAVPGAQLDEWAGRVKRRKHTTLRFREDDVLTTRVASRLAWESRLDHHRHLLLSTREKEEEARDQRVDIQPLSAMVVMDLLLSLGLSEIGSDGETYLVPDSVRQLWEEDFKAASIDCDEGGVRDAAYLAAGLAALKRAAKIDPELGLSLVVLNEMANALLVVLGVKGLLDRFEREDASEPVQADG